MKILNVYRSNTTNIGDVYSSPVKYFDWLTDARIVDIWLDSIEKEADIEDSMLIIGGGGLISNIDFKVTMEKLSSYPFRKKVIWGAGHNIHDKREIYSFPSFIKNFDLVGIRDHNQLESWVPCPSCLHTAFDRDYQIDHNFIVYEHKDHPLNINKAPRRNNRSRDIESVISFLGSGETIITNTYHGVYWGTLLNRKVIIIDPFSSKFYGFKHPHPISTLSGWKHVNNTVYYPTALEECRTANLKFNSSVKDFFEKS